jgi:hypothetical protein
MIELFHIIKFYKKNIYIIYMSFFKIYGAGTPLNNINGSLVNVDSSHVAGIPFTNKIVPNGPQTLAPAGSNVQGAAGIYPCSLKGGKINKKKINKISRKYKMKGSKSNKRTMRRLKSRVYKKRSSTSRRGRGRGRKMRGGTSSRNIPEGTLPSHPLMKGGAHPAVAPNYPAGHNQYENNKIFSNTFSTGGPLSPQLSALANPPPITMVKADPDNLNHAAPNAYGNYGAGSGFPSRGWF